MIGEVVRVDEDGKLVTNVVVADVAVVDAGRRGGEVGPKELEPGSPEREAVTWVVISESVARPGDARRSESLVADE